MLSLSSTPRICEGCRFLEGEHNFDPLGCALVGAFGTPIIGVPEVYSEEAKSYGKAMQKIRAFRNESREDLVSVLGLYAEQIGLVEEGRLPVRYVERHVLQYLGYVLEDIR